MEQSCPWCEGFWMQVSFGDFNQEVVEGNGSVVEKTQNPLEEFMEIYAPPRRIRRI